MMSLRRSNKTRFVAIKTFFALLVAWGAAAGVLAMSPEVERLQDQWAEIKYRSPKESHEEKFAHLVKEAQRVSSRAPSDPEALIWHAIIEGSYAGAKGGFGALSLAKNAKEILERAILIDPAAMDGSGLTSLGSLYYQTPGWPLGFGDDKKALEYLRRGLAVNPQGIDANFFYGDFLYRSGEYAAAEAALRKALRAPLRPGRSLADEGRVGEIEELLRKIAEKKR